jgi:arginase
MKKIVLIGVPSDFGANIIGAREGPTQLRKILLPMLNKQSVDYADCGDVVVPISKRETKIGAKNINQIRSVCKNFLQLNKAHMPDRFPVVIGGDHSIVSCLIAELSLKKELGLIWFDAHGDYNTPQTSPSGNVHGMPLNDISNGSLQNLLQLKTRLIPQKNIVLFGVRDLDPDEDKMLRASRITVIRMDFIKKNGVSKSLRKAIRTAKRTDGFHMSFDVDVIDPSVAPGVSTPVMGGFTKVEVLEFADLLSKEENLRSLDIVELNPRLDDGNRTSQIVSEMIMQLIR